MAEEREADLQQKLKDHEATANINAERNVQQIERNIHAENQELTEKTMSQRYTLDYYRREKEQLKAMQSEKMRDLDIETETGEKYEIRGRAQQRRIGVLKEKILVLEKSLQ